MPSPPQKPTAGNPAFTTAATTFLFTIPARTMSATSRVSASVMRSPSMKSLCLRSRLRVRVRAFPPPWTRATRCPSFARSTTARVHLCNVASSSSATPPILITIFKSTPSFRQNRLSQKPFFFVKPEHQVHVLDRLPRGAFDQVVLAGNDDQALAVWRQAETNVAIIRVQRELNFRQLGRSEHADEPLSFVEIAIAGFEFACLSGLLEMHIDRGQNAARDRKQMRRGRQLT